MKLSYSFFSAAVLATSLFTGQAAAKDIRFFVDTPPWKGRAIYEDGQFVLCNLSRHNAERTEMAVRIQASGIVSVLFWNDDWLLEKGATLPARIELAGSSFAGSVEARDRDLLRYVPGKGAGFLQALQRSTEMEADLGGALHAFPLDNIATLVPALQRCFSEATGGSVADAPEPAAKPAGKGAKAPASKPAAAPVTKPTPAAKPAPSFSDSIGKGW